jgi:hypothetical protein
MQPDFSDIRFTWYNTTDGSEIEIPYWIERQSNSQWAYVWVKVIHIPASSTATIYVYYGNTTPVSSNSNIQNTFPFADDFDDGSINTTKWTNSGGTHNIKGESNGVLWVVGDTYIDARTFKFKVPFAVVTRVRVNSTAAKGYTSLMTNSTGYTYGGNQNQVNVQLYTGGTVNYCDTFNNGVMTETACGTWSANTFERWEIKINSTHAFFHKNFNTTPADTHTTNIPNDKLLFPQISHYEVANVKQDTDYFFVRSYAANGIEPTYSIGAEETVPYISVTFSYSSISFGTVNPYSLAPAIDQNLGYLNVSVNATADYQVKAYALDWTGPQTIPASTLYFDTNETYSNLSYNNSIQLSTSYQIIDTYPLTVTTNYHGFWFNVPLAYAGDYNTTITIDYSTL